MEAKTSGFSFSCFALGFFQTPSAAEHRLGCHLISLFYVEKLTNKDGRFISMHSKIFSGVMVVGRYGSISQYLFFYLCGYF